MRLGYCVVVFLSVLAGCSSGIYKYQAYEGPERLPDEIATLHVNGQTNIHEIDGKGRYSPGGSSAAFPYHGATISVLPGEHTVSLTFRGQASAPIEAVFIAESGAHYQIRYTLQRAEDNRQYAKVWIEPFIPSQQT